MPSMMRSISVIVAAGLVIGIGGLAMLPQAAEKPSTVGVRVPDGANDEAARSSPLPNGEPLIGEPAFRVAAEAIAQAFAALPQGGTGEGTIETIPAWRSTLAPQPQPSVPAVSPQAAWDAVAPQPPAASQSDASQPAASQLTESESNVADRTVADRPVADRPATDRSIAESTVGERAAPEHIVVTPERAMRDGAARARAQAPRRTFTERARTRRHAAPRRRIAITVHTRDHSQRVTIRPTTRQDAYFYTARPNLMVAPRSFW